MNIAIFANTSWYIYNFRLSTIKALQRQGHTVIAISPEDGYSDKLRAEGVVHVPVNMAGSRVNPFYELGTLTKLYECLKKNRIDVVLSFTPKANIYGSLLAGPVRAYNLANVSGLGRLFINPTPVTSIARLLYKFAFVFSEHIFFQNQDDRDLFVEQGLARPHKTSLLPGSGIDLNKFSPDSPVFESASENSFRFLLVGRVLWDKGIGEYIEAARIIKRLYPQSQFEILGELGADNPAAIGKIQLDEWIEEGLVHYHGYTDDVRPYLAKAHCVVLPSYREGTPRSLLEAAAMGKPIVTTDVPGCRNVVEHENNGYLCEAKSGQALASAMQRILRLTDNERIAMGQRGREKMEQEFSEEIVINAYINAIERLPKGRFRIRKKISEHISGSKS